MHQVIPITPSGLPAVPSILGQAPVRMPIGGKIRSGIKVLTASAAKHVRAKEIYDAGVAAGKAFEQIETEITQAVPELKNGGLKPQNVAYFTVRRVDFAMPEIAELILEKYGETGEGGIKRLYRFPAVFAGNTWEAVMPHGLSCFGASQLKYWSEYTADGRERYCMQYAPVAFDSATKRPIRVYGGRRSIPSPENDGRCEPERCREYQTRQCNLSGRFVFLIPGIPSLSAIELPTNSFYAMNHARQLLMMVAGLRGGSIAGKLGRQSFWFSKKLREVSMLDPDKGTPTRVKQWLIELEAPMDLTDLMTTSADDAARLLAAQRGVAALNGYAVNAQAEVLVESTVAVSPESPRRQDSVDLFGASQQAAPDAAALKAQIKQLRQQAHALIQRLGLDAEQFALYASERYGIEDWSTNVAGLHQAIAELQRHEANPEALQLAIENLLRV